MRHFIGFAIALTALACREAAPPPETEAGRVLEAVQREGPDSVAHRMDRDDAFGERVLDGIASGDSIWLEVAVSLRPTGTAGIAEALPIMVAEALPKAPERVLALIAERRFSIDEVCSIPFIEPSDSLVAAYYAQVSTALARVDRVDLAATRDRCRAALETAHKVGAPVV